MSKKKHYYLVASELVFIEEGAEGHGVTRMNTVIQGESTTITSRVLAKAQQAVQLNFHKRMESSAFKVVDVVILNITHLGEMTEEEFLGPKESKVMTA